MGINTQLSPTKPLAVFVWNGQQWTPWDGAGSAVSSKSPVAPLEGVGLYFFSNNQWVPWDGSLSGGGGGTGGVTKIIAGTNITISPSTGVGDVTVNASGSGPSSSDDFTKVFMLMGA